MNGSNIQRYFLLVLLAGAAWVAFLVIQPFFSALALGAVFAVVLQPIYTRVLKQLKGKEALAALATVGLSILIVLIPILFVSMQLLKEAQGLYGSLSDTDTQRVFSVWISENGPKLDNYVPNASQSLRELSSSFDDYARQGASWIVLNIGAAFSSIAALFLNLFIFFVTLYYLLRDGGRLKEYLIELSPLKDTDDEHIVHKLETAVNSVVKGKLAIAGIHLSDIPPLNYQTHLFQERQVRSVTSNTRADAREFLEFAGRHRIEVTTPEYRLDQADVALEDLSSGRIAGAAVLLV